MATNLHETLPAIGIKAQPHYQVAERRMDLTVMAKSKYLALQSTSAPTTKAPAAAAKRGTLRCPRNIHSA